MPCICRLCFMPVSHGTPAHQVLVLQGHKVPPALFSHPSPVCFVALAHLEEPVMVETQRLRPISHKSPLSEAFPFMTCPNAHGTPDLTFTADEEMEQSIAGEAWSHPTGYGPSGLQMVDWTSTVAMGKLPRSRLGYVLCANSAMLGIDSCTGTPITRDGCKKQALPEPDIG